MKKVLLMLLAASLYLISCTKSGTISKQDEQRGRKVKTTELSVALETTFPAGEDAIISIDSAKWTLENVGTGNMVYWSVRADETLLPFASNVWVEVRIEAGQVDKFGQVATGSYWSTIGQWKQAIEVPGGSGFNFDGYPGQVETRIYRAGFIDKNGIMHHSSAYQIN